ncbi:MAG: hypothetical protein V4465_02905 [Patescibacteria group bacterium]
MTRKRDLSNLTIRYFLRPLDGDQDGPTITELKELSQKIRFCRIACVDGSNRQTDREIIPCSQATIIALQEMRKSKHLKFEVYAEKTDGKARLQKTRIKVAPAKEMPKPVRRPKAF